MRETEQMRQGREGAADDERRGRDVGALDLRGVDADGGFGDHRGFAQKGGFALVLFDQVDLDAEGDGEDQAGEAGAGPEVDGARRCGCRERTELQTVLDMARPQDIEVGGADQVDGLVPFSEEVGVGVQGGVHGDRPHLRKIFMAA